jgi:thiol-disulfide isomerase/thioredoxin
MLKRFYTMMAAALMMMALPFAGASAMEKQANIQADMQAQKASVYIVMYHADWCGSCKVLAPHMSEARGMLDEETAMKVEFIKFDLTDEASKEATKEMAQEKGFGDVYANAAKTGSKTGYGDIFGADMQKRGKITKSFSAAEIVGAIKSAIAADE